RRHYAGKGRRSDTDCRSCTREFPPRRQAPVRYGWHSSTIAWLPPQKAGVQSVSAEHLDGLVEAAIPLRPTQESHALDQNLLRRRLLQEQAQRLVNELVKRHVTFAGRLPGREFGLDRGRGEFDDLDPSLELFAKGNRVGVDRRLGCVVSRRTA